MHIPNCKMIFVGVSAAPCTQCNKQTNVRFMRTRQCLKYSIDCDVCVTLDALSFLSASHVLGGAAFVLHYAAGQADRRAGGTLTTDAVAAGCRVNEAGRRARTHTVVVGDGRQTLSITDIGYTSTSSKGSDGVFFSDVYAEYKTMNRSFKAF